MRRLQQKTILDTLNTLEEARAEIKRTFDKGAYETVKNGLLDCYSFAGHIQSFIVEAAGEGTHTHDLLEEFKTCLAQMYEALKTVEEETAGSGKSDGDNFLKTLRKSIIQIKDSVKNELKPDKIEVVFMPYKASMFDSLESIYRAAKDDPNCDTYVVSVPYYEYTAEHILGEIRDESNLYPADIPITDWREYDAETRRPDVIFIHNPYDDANYVTCVHPNFHSKRLMNFTDMLVYVPYFVAGDDVAEEFCVLPGTIYSDKVIVQSEKVRQTYIRVFKEWAKKESGITRGHPLWHKVVKPEEKFVALGSPKFDAVINAKPEDFHLPDEWRKLIEKPDGSKNKVIFYNSRFTNMEIGAENMIAKLRIALKTFRERDDVVCWFRPHPLNMSCLESMRPWLAKEYDEIIMEYRREGWGIYDDTPNLHRAIAWSDAYFGDGSSVVALYQFTGKPIILGNISTETNGDVIDDNYLSSLSVGNVYDDREAIWFSAYNVNCLFKMNKTTFDIQLLKRFPIDIYGQYGAIACYDKKLYFPLFNTPEVIIYDIENNFFDTLSFAVYSNYIVKHHRCFVVSTVYKNYLFLAGEMPAITRYNLDNGAIDFFDDWINILKSQFGIDWTDMFCASTIGKNSNQLLLLHLNSNYITIFDMDECKSEVMKVGDKNEGFNNMCFDGESFWLTRSYSHSVVRFNAETRNYSELILPSNFTGNDKLGRNFASILYINNSILLFPSVGNKALSIDISTLEVSISLPFQAVCDEKPENNFNQFYNYRCAVFDNECIYAFSLKLQQLIGYNFVLQTSFQSKLPTPTLGKLYESKKLTHKKALSTSRFINQNLKSFTDVRDGYFCENEHCSLGELLTLLDDEIISNEFLTLKKMRLAFFADYNAYTDGTAGEAIYNYAKKSILEVEARH